MPVKNTSKLKKNITTKKTVNVKQNTSKKSTAVTTKKTSAQLKRKTAPVKINSTVSAKSKSGEKLTPRGKKLMDIKKKLMQQRETLLAEAEMALNSLPSQSIFPDLGDQVSAEIDRNFMLRLRGREQKLLLKIDEAIDKIEADNFGICEACGQEIDIKRLLARPVTTMCITCKTEQEEEEEKMRRDR